MEQNELATAIEFGEKKTQLLETDLGQVLVHPVETAVTKFFEPKQIPDYLKQEISVFDLQSFVDYHNRFCDSNSVIFFDKDNCVFKSVLDYHQEDRVPRFCHHVVKYACPKSNEWDLWFGSNGSKMTQQEFAGFIEDCLLEVIEPSGAEMLEVVSTLKANIAVDFRSAVVLENGQTQFRYEEKIDGTAGKTNQLNIPSVIKLAIAPFVGGNTYELEARFRYRIKDASLYLWYDLIRPHRVLDHAIEAMVTHIRENINHGTIFHGEFRRA